MAVEIIEAEIRSGQQEVLLEAAKLVLSGDPGEIARQLRERAERTIRPQFGHKERHHVCRLVDGGQTVLGDRH